VFYDQRGRGKTQAPADPDDARIAHDAADVVALREALGLRRWDVLGHSWGGGIAALAAERDRSGVRGLVLVDAVGPTNAWLDALHDRASARLAPQSRALLQHLDPRALLQGNPDAHSAHAAALEPAWFAEPEMAKLFRLPRSASHTGSAVAAAVRREGYDWTAQFRAVVAHTLVIHGERDLLPVRVAGELAALISQARLEIIPDCGHMPFWEAPETFFAQVEDFLSSLNHRSPS
jgi:proline iminopeptidase